MALINCPECGKEVSDKAAVCIHCGAPLNERNGDIKIRCRMLNGSLMKAVITTEDGRELCRIAQGGVATIHINKDERVKISCFGFKGTQGVLQYRGTNNYEISCTSGFFVLNLLFNKVDHVDSE